MKRRNWTLEEVEFLKTQSLSVSECAVKFNRNPTTVSNKVSELGLKMPRKKTVKSLFKTCCSCKEEKPRTTEYFFTKKAKNNKTGVYEYMCFRSTCKSCHGKISYQQQRNKRIKEIGCTEENYRESWLKASGDSHKKYKYLEGVGIPNKSINTIKEKIRNGYVFTTYDQYIVDSKKTKRNAIILKGKSDYSDIPKEYILWCDVPKDIKNKILKERDPNDSKLANWLGFKISEVDEETLKTKRVLVSMNRYIKNNG